MKKLQLFICIIISLEAFAQFPGTDSLRTYNIKYITTNPATAFTNRRLNVLIAGMIDWIDSARAGEGGTIGVDTIGVLNDSTLRYRDNGVWRTLTIKGVYDNRRKVDSAFSLNDSTIRFVINGDNRDVVITGISTLTNNKLDSTHIYVASGTDPDTLYEYKEGDSALVGVIYKEATTASNGLTLSGNDIQLGGELTEVTTIDGIGTGSLMLNNLTQFTAQAENPSDPSNFSSLTVRYNVAASLRKQLNSNQFSALSISDQFIGWSVTNNNTPYVNTMTVNEDFTLSNSRLALYNAKKGAQSIATGDVKADLHVFGDALIRDSLKIGIVPNGNSNDSVVVWSATDSLLKKLPASTMAVTTSADATLTLSTGGAYVFTGTTTTWTLPAVAGTTGRTYWIKNKGSGNITLNADSGNNEIYDSAATNTLAVTPGTAVRLVSDGTHFLTM